MSDKVPVSEAPISSLPHVQPVRAWRSPGVAHSSVTAILARIGDCAERMQEAAGAIGDRELADTLSQMIATCAPLIEEFTGDRASSHTASPCGGATAARRAAILELSARVEQRVANHRLRILAADTEELRIAAADLRKMAIDPHPSLTSAQPVQPFVGAGQSEPSPAAVEAAVSQAAPPTGLILIVDDNEGNRDLLSRRLSRNGHKVIAAESGFQALSLTEQHSFDLILLDIMMPGMDGFEVLAHLKKSSSLRHIPVVMISAMDEIESVVRCIEQGADDYLTKPVNPVLLRARINALLERKRLRDEELSRARELEQASLEIDRQRRRSEAMLLNILPESVAAELRLNGRVEPMYFEDVTIVFADFVGFTLATEQLPADDLVNILHEYFTAFDRITSRYGLEKLKTIGDCYMFAGGIPHRNPSHPVDAILAALEMIHATAELAKTGPAKWLLRVGVHTGPVVAGVVGIHKFAFDIWGDSVNLAQRMEANGVPSRVNLSINTYSRIKDFFRCEKRGVIATKEGRQVEMFLVDGIASRSKSDDSATRVETFLQRYQTYFRKSPQTFLDFLGSDGSN